MILLIVIAAAGCERDGLHKLAAGEKGRVADVRTGDTLVLEDGLVVRLTGVDAPNLDQAYAAEAKAALSTLADGKDVELLYGGERRDAYGRALAQVRIKGQGVWLQKQLIDGGYARVSTYADNRALAGTLLEAEAVARRKSAGLWRLPDYRVRLPLEMRGRRGFQIIEGRVTGAFSAPGGAELDLDDLVTVEIPQRRLIDFSRAKLDPGTLKGRLVRVRGYVRRDGSIRADHPEQVEALREPQ